MGGSRPHPYPSPRGGTLLTLLGLGLGCNALAQAPDIRARLDLALTFDYQNRNSQSARLYTPLGRPSTVGLSAFLESGYHIVASERLQRLPQDADGDILDEAYFEDPGIFRVGKQYLPFGTGRLLRESVAAARVDSSLIAEGVPVTLAGVQNGQGRQNGLALRVGRNLGVSYLLGDHFGIAATSLGVVRHPEDAPGRGGGWRQAIGFDASRRYGKVAVSGEFVALNGGPQRSLSVFDAEVTISNDAYRSIGAGFTQAFGPGNASFYRVFGRVHASRNIDVEPLVRLKDARLFDLAATLRFRL